MILLFKIQCKRCLCIFCLFFNGQCFMSKTFHRELGEKEREIENLFSVLIV